MKIRGVFLAFDVDESGYIDRKELMTLLLHGVQGLCKMVGIRPVPHREDITQFAYYVFKQIDVNNCDSIGFQEFSAWVRASEDI